MCIRSTWLWLDPDFKLCTWPQTWHGMSLVRSTLPDTRHELVFHIGSSLFPFHISYLQQGTSRNDGYSFCSWADWNNEKLHTSLVLKAWHMILDSQGDGDHALKPHYHALSLHYTSHCQGTNIAPAITVLALIVWSPHLFWAHFCSVSCCSALNPPPVLYPPNCWASDTEVRAHPWYTSAKTSQGTVRDSAVLGSGLHRPGCYECHILNFRM